MTEQFRPGQAKTAYHEAGHALMARVLGYEVSMVSIVPDIEAGILGWTDPIGMVEGDPWDSILFFAGGHHYREISKARLALQSALQALEIAEQAREADVAKLAELKPRLDQARGFKFS